MSAYSEMSFVKAIGNVFIRPRVAIGTLAEPRFQKFLAAAFVGALTIWFLFSAFSPFADFALMSEPKFWWLFLAAALICAVMGLVAFYLNGVIGYAIGRAFGGEGSAAKVRAALFWSNLPSLIFGSLIGLLVWWSGAGAGNNGVHSFQILLNIALGFWTFVLLVAMLSRVLNVGVFRALCVGFLVSLVVPLLFAVLVRTFWLQPFNIPASSMSPTLVIGDNFFAEKYAYGFSKYSIPFGPNWFSGRIFGATPKRGDVVVFKYLVDNVTDYVKRIVGLPGDKVQMLNGELFINGEKVQRKPVAAVAGAAQAKDFAIYEETLPDSSPHLIQVKRSGADPVANTTPLMIVPAGSYYMLGDNRDNSADSRFWGTVPFENLVGRAGWIFLSGQAPNRELPNATRLERTGQRVN